MLVGQPQLDPLGGRKGGGQLFLPLWVHAGAVEGFRIDPNPTTLLAPFRRTPPGTTFALSLGQIWQSLTLQGAKREESSSVASLGEHPEALFQMAFDS